MKKLLYYSFLSGMALLALSGETQALTCTAAPSCADLGYTKTSCSGGGGVKCPFDSSKMFCIREGGGTDYKFNNAISRYQIAYSDGTTGKYYNEDKVAIGVVTHVHSFGDRKHGIIMSLPTFTIQNQEQARKICAAYTTAGTMAGDWRLPTLAELSTFTAGYAKDEYNDIYNIESALKTIPTAGSLYHSHSYFYGINDAVDKKSNAVTGQFTTYRDYDNDISTYVYTSLYYLSDTNVSSNNANVYYSYVTSSTGVTSSTTKSNKVAFRCVAEF